MLWAFCTHISGVTLTLVNMEASAPKTTSPSPVPVNIQGMKELLVTDVSHIDKPVRVTFKLEGITIQYLSVNQTMSS